LHEFDGDAKNYQCRSRGQGHKIRSRGALSPRTGIEDSITDLFAGHEIDIQLSFSLLNGNGSVDCVSVKVKI